MNFIKKFESLLQQKFDKEREIASMTLCVGNLRIKPMTFNSFYLRATVGNQEGDFQNIHKKEALAIIKYLSVVVKDWPE